MVMNMTRTLETARVAGGACRMRLWATVGWAALAVAAVGCWPFDPAGDCAQTYRCGEGTTGGGGTGGTGGADPGCVPSEISAVVPDTCGVFVQASGDDATGDGTKQKPFATLAKALAKGATIYACADEKPLDEALAVSGEVRLYGGLDCATWVYAAGSKTSWTAPAGEVVAAVKKGAKLHAEDFAVAARDAPALMAGEYAPGESSIAIVAEKTSTVDLTRCDVSAGNGGDGAAGEPPTGTAATGAIGDAGNGGCDSSMGEFPGNGGATTCDGTDVSGGKGGLGSLDMSGGDGSAGQPFGAAGKGGLGQTAAICEDGGVGMVGSAGLAGTGAGMDGSGSLTVAGFVGASGGNGMAGTPGQGGGGGGGAKLCSNGKAGPSGGGAGAGGCGGAGGKAGYGGGASLGIADLGATLKLSEVKITTAKGGKGGAGANGQAGGTGGAGGLAGVGDAQAKACAGGKGGDGGVGGKGGGGRGGPSVGIAFTGAAPDVKGATITFGTPGDGGTGDGDTGMGATGVAAKTHSF
jgi:hypothetical protein